MATTPKRELYDAAEYVGKVDLMIAKLRTTKPGEVVGKVGKNEILSMRRDALQELVKDGYTVSQIAEAMKNDVFGILPKTITEIVGNKKKKVKVTVSKQLPTVKATADGLNTAKQQPTVGNFRKTNKELSVDAGSISVTKDTEDL